MAIGDQYRRVDPSDQLVFNAAGALVGVKSGLSTGGEGRMMTAAEYTSFQASVSGAVISADAGNALTLGADSLPLLTQPDQAEAEAGSATTARGWTALRVRQAIAAWWAATASTLIKTVNGSSLLGPSNLAVGTVTASGGALTANAVVLGAGATDTKSVAGITTDGIGTLSLSVAIKTPKIYPQADSTTAVQFTKADASTAVLTVDTTNARLGINQAAPSQSLHVNGAILATSSVNANSGAVGFGSYGSYAGVYGSGGLSLLYFDGAAVQRAFTWSSSGDVTSHRDAAVTRLLHLGKFTTGAAPTAIAGATYFDLTLGKERIGNNTPAWETVTSA